MKTPLLLASAGLLTGIAAVILTPPDHDTAPQPAAATEASQPTSCALVDNGNMGRATQAGFAPVHPTPFDGILGIKLGDPLQRTCDALLARGFALAVVENQRVDVTDRRTGQDGDKTAAFSYLAVLEGESANPFDGATTPTTIVLRASSPATYASVDAISVRFEHTPPLTTEAWKQNWAQKLIAHFGPASASNELIPEHFWIVSNDAPDPRHHGDVCNPEIADYRYGPSRAISRTTMPVPPHDGINCTVLVKAGFAPDPEVRSMVGSTYIRFYDMVSISGNRKRVLQHLLAVQYPAE